MNRDITHIQELLDRYMDGENTQEELRELKEYFLHTDDIPHEFLPYKEMFELLEKPTVIPSVKALEAFTQPKQKRKQIKQLWYWIAAACVAGMVVMLLYPSANEEKDAPQIAKAETKAAEIIETAQAKAKEIIKKAEKDAADYRAKIEGDVKMASVQSIQTTKKDIENIMLKGMVSKDVKSSLSSAEFVKEVILAVARNFNPDETAEVEALLPESLKAEIEPFISSELSKIIGTGFNANFSKKVSGGFNIGPKDGSYFISLTDEAFEELISEYLRPATRKALFGE